MPRQVVLVVKNAKASPKWWYGFGLNTNTVMEGVKVTQFPADPKGQAVTMTYNE